MTGGCKFTVCVLTIMSIGLLIIAGMLTGKRLLRFIRQMPLVLAGIFMAYWIFKLLIIPGAFRVFEALKQMAAGIAYVIFAVILLFGIMQLMIFTLRSIHIARNIGKRRNYETVFDEITAD